MKALVIAALLIATGSWALAEKTVFHPMDQFAVLPQSSAVDCAGFHSFLREKHIKIGPTDMRRRFDAAAPRLLDFADSLAGGTVDTAPDDRAAQVAFYWADRWSASEGDDEKRIALFPSMMNQYYRCVSMVDDLVGAGRLEVR